MTSIELVLSKIPDAKRSGAGWTARCPAHSDKRPSLSVSEGEDGRALVYCHAGCTPEEIAAAMELKMSDLMPAAPTTARPMPKNSGKRKSFVQATYATAEDAVAELDRQHGTHAATWSYQRADGGLVGMVVRWNTPVGKDIRPVSNILAGWIIGGMPEPRPLYRLPELLARPGERVLVCEGEKATDAATKLGYLATTSAQGSQSASKTDWTPLAGRKVVIFPDNDKAGEGYAADVVGILAKLDPPGAVRIVNPGTNGMALPPKGDMADWVERHRSAGHDENTMRHDLETLIGQSTVMAVAESLADPLPLPPGLPAVMPFDYALLPKSLRPWVSDVAERMQCPADFVAVAVLASAGALIGRKIAIRPKQYDDWQVVANLWALLIGSPSLMKSPSMREALKTIHRLQADAQRQYAQATEEHRAHQLLGEADSKAHKQTLEKLVKSGMRDEAEALAQKMAAGQEDFPPTERVYIVHDATVEALGVVLNQNPDGVLLVRDELAGWLRTMDREGHENDRAFYLQAWDGLGGYEYRRIGRGTLKIESVALSVVGTIQPGVISDYIRQAVIGGNGDDGLAQRFQLGVWPDTPAEWRNIDRYPDADAKAAADTALVRLANLTPEVVKAQRDALDRVALPFLRFDDAAQMLFDAWHADLMRRCRSGEDHSAIESHLLKYKKLVPALALIFHLLEGRAGAVTADAARLALTWAAYLESHARRVYAVVGRAPALSAQLLARRIEKGELPDNFTARDIYNRCWGGLDRERTQAALDVLVSARWLEEHPDQTGGRPTTRYTINPKLRIPQVGEPSKPSKPSFAGSAGSTSNDPRNSGHVGVQAEGRERGEL
ncbi:MAG TPA: DUF3987 domain-containing protein [Phycisphaerae bacterium]|nr:DUF3987 domain-containing protein [Phycisphaerae bacterium]